MKNTDLLLTKTDTLPVGKFKGTTIDVMLTTVTTTERLKRTIDTFALQVDDEVIATINEILNKEKE